MASTEQFKTASIVKKKMMILPRDLTRLYNPSRHITLSSLYVVDETLMLNC